MVCKSCGAVIESNLNECPYCGREIEKAKQQEPQTVIINNYNYASSEQKAPRVQKINQTINVEFVSDKNKIVALVLCILLGYFGVHKFYVGKKSSGVLYLFTCGLMGIGWFVDIFLIATGKFKDSHGLKLK